MPLRQATPKLRPETRRLSAVALATISWLGGCSAGHAQTVVLQPTLRPAGETDDLLGMFSSKPMAQRSLRDNPTRNYQGLPFEGWMLYPSLFLGGIHDDNIYLAQTQRVKGEGIQAIPTFIADRDRGVQHTKVFVNGSLNIYPGNWQGNLINGEMGVGHVWEVQRDLVVRLGAEYDINSDVYSNGFLYTPYGSATIKAPQRRNTVGGFVSAVKSFDKVFVGLSASAYETTYDSLFTSVGSLPQAYRDNLLGTATARLGYSFSPAVYSFVEGSANVRNYSSETAYGVIAPGVWTAGTFFNSQGYRVITGLGSDRISLFKGEIYGGFQQQDFATSILGTHSSAVYGGKVSWFPTRAWTVSLSLDEIFQDAALPLYSNPLGNSAFVTQATAIIQYAIAKEWNFLLRGGYANYRYLSGTRTDNSWTGNFTFNYEITRNLMATANYTFYQLESTAAGASYTRNVFGLGATYKY
ncbi:outer membrane beta-barrel protein [Methylocystis heyeri]|uniref:Outer membrane beta-barrel protein n=1 Tax=Methylocystis heyeri TaxID=391905 RepID=A0A6B8KJ98_9HYPH|nr:outer membrane beta-barrel protein [Methylocystis heyeri]QGM47131.1 outer membrane beta-barrel protein [Methylocystis heyeri]